MIFKNRSQAGKLLAEKVFKEELGSSIVYALPRGGVAVACEIAKKLKAPLELIIARKIGHPFNPEYAIAAVTETGPVVANDTEVSQLDSQEFEKLVQKERQEAARRRKVYLGERLPISPQGKTAIIVDDGIATGLTVKAAFFELKKLKARAVIIAVPVMPIESYNELCQIVDQVIALEIPQFFAGAIGAYYEDFNQVGDREVKEILSAGLTPEA